MPADDSTRPGPGQALRKVAFRVFYGIPGRWRRRLVRLLKPRYTVGAVTLLRATGPGGVERLLLLRQPPGSGWSLPGGLMNRRERPAECAARELVEETGIRLDPGDLVPANPNALVHRGWIDCVFEARVDPDTAITVDGAEVYEAGFHRVDALPPLTVATARVLGHYGLGPYADYPETRLL